MRHASLDCRGVFLPGSVRRGQEVTEMSQSNVAQAIKRSRQYFSESPAKARTRALIATAGLEDGLRVRIDSPHGWSLVMDMGPGVGGKGSAPTPGWVLRSASAACLVSLIAMRAAETGVSLSLLEVDVDSESDDRGAGNRRGHTRPAPSLCARWSV